MERVPCVHPKGNTAFDDGALEPRSLGPGMPVHGIGGIARCTARAVPRPQWPPGMASMPRRPGLLLVSPCFFFCFAHFAFKNADTPPHDVTDFVRFTLSINGAACLVA